jgi:hypothetical protein
MQIAQESGFDGFVAVDKSDPSHTMVNVISTAVRDGTDLMISYQRLMARSRFTSDGPIAVALSDMACHVPI